MSLHKTLNYFVLIHKYIPPTSELFHKYLFHCTQVAIKSVQIGRRLSVNKDELKFLEEASMLHDIGICQVGKEFNTPYICHGIKGEEILKREGFAKHAAVALNHIGLGLTADSVAKNKLPLPHKDMAPTTLCERIITYSDLFFSKSSLFTTRSFEQVRQKIESFDESKVALFEKWRDEFE